MLWVGGGDGSFYALDATNGSIVWKTKLVAAPNGFIWSSPAIFGGNIYIGSSSFGDCPVTQGRLWMLNAANGVVEHVLSTVPGRCTGAGIWSSPAIDTRRDTLYVGTALGTCPGRATPPLADSMLEVRTSNIDHVVSSWQIPRSDRTGEGDTDFGAAPVLFRAVVDGAREPLVGDVSKNGIFYAFVRDHLSAGPIWQDRVAEYGTGCPQCGDGSISPAAWDGTSLFIAGGTSKMRGATCKGSLSSIEPATGQAVWRDCLPGPVLGAVTAVPGLVFVNAGHKLVVVASGTGRVLFGYSEPSGEDFYGPVTVAGGTVYDGNADGSLRIFGLS